MDEGIVESEVHGPAVHASAVAGGAAGRTVLCHQYEKRMKVFARLSQQTMMLAAICGEGIYWYRDSQK